MENSQYYIVRCTNAGVFFGRIRERNEKEVVMEDVRKLWYWEGACSVEELAVNGTTCSDKCKFTVTVSEMSVLEPIQIIPCTGEATESIKGVPDWKRS